MPGSTSGSAGPWFTAVLMLCQSLRVFKCTRERVHPRDFVLISLSVYMCAGCLGDSACACLCMYAHVSLSFQGKPSWPCGHGCRVGIHLRDTVTNGDNHACLVAESKGKKKSRYR